jgi:hypothetical protein
MLVFHFDLSGTSVLLSGWLGLDRVHSGIKDSWPIWAGFKLAEVDLVMRIWLFSRAFEVVEPSSFKRQSCPICMVYSM